MRILFCSKGERIAGQPPLKSSVPQRSLLLSSSPTISSESPAHKLAGKVFIPIVRRDHWELWGIWSGIVQDEDEDKTILAQIMTDKNR